MIQLLPLVRTTFLPDRASCITQCSRFASVSCPLPPVQPCTIACLLLQDLDDSSCWC